PRDKKLIGGRKTRKNEDRILRRALCRPSGGIAAWQRARLYCRIAQAFAARQDQDNTHGIIGETLKKGFPFRSDSETNEPPLRTYQLWKKTFYEETHKLDDMTELPKSQPKKTYEEDLEGEIVMVKMPSCLSFLGCAISYDEPIASIQNLETKFDRLADKQSGRPSGSLPSNTQPNPKGHNSKAYQPPQSRNEHVNAVFTRSGKSYNPLVNSNDQQNNSENPINFNDSDEEDKEPTPQPKNQNLKQVKETTLPKPYKPKISYPQRLRKEKMEAQYGKFLDVICAVRINVPLIDILPSETFSYSTMIPPVFCIDVIDEILEEYFDALLDEGSKILHSIKGTLLEEEIFAEFDEFMAMTADENSNSESDIEDPPFEKITINTDYKMKTSLKEPLTDLKLKPLPDNPEYVFLEEPSFLLVIISSQLSKEKKNKLIFVLKKHKQAFA
ncbi:hypothetical protein Tco_0465921, partial [Tanacetum coccineum]